MARSFKRSSFRFVPLLAAFSSLVGCAGGPGRGSSKESEPPQVVITNIVQVVIVDGPRKGQAPPQIDFKDKRIQIASEAIAKLLGHSVIFEIDDGLLPKFDARLHEAFVEALETVVTNLEYVVRYYPDATAFAGPHLGTIRWTYSPSKGEARAELDVEKNRLEVPVPGDAWRLQDDALITDAFDSAWDREKERRYTHLAPDAVPPSEHKAYLDFQQSYRGRTKDESEVQYEKRKIASVVNILRLYPKLSDEKLQKEAREYLVNRSRDLRDWLAQVKTNPDLKSAVRSVHEQWVRWLNASFRDLTDVQQRDIGSRFFSYSHDWLPELADGLDVAAIAEPRIVSWLERLKEGDRNRFDAEDGANASIVCPYTFQKSSGLFDSPGRCNGLVYVKLSNNGRNFTDLNALLHRQNSTLLTQTAALNVLSNLGSETAAQFVETLFRNESHAKGALIALADFSDWGPRSHRSDGLPKLSPTPFIKKIPSWWKTYPTYRSEFLYLLVRLGSRYEGSVVWPKLGEYLGAQLDAGDVTGFLKIAPNTIWHLRSLVRAVGAWPRSKVLIPEFERFLNDVHESGRGEPSPYYVADRCVEFLCMTGTHQDVRALQTFIRDRVERYPSEKRHLESFLESSPAKLCPTARAGFEAQEKKTTVVVFED
jgi:hypothetical protein